MSFINNLTTSAEWIYTNGQMIIGVGLLCVFGYFCWMKNVKGIIFSGLGIITNLILGW